VAPSQGRGFYGNFSTWGLGMEEVDGGGEIEGSWVCFEVGEGGR